MYNIVCTLAIYKIFAAYDMEICIFADQLETGEVNSIIYVDILVRYEILLRNQQPSKHLKDLNKKYLDYLIHPQLLKSEGLHLLGSKLHFLSWLLRSSKFIVGYILVVRNLFLVNLESG